MLTDSGKSRPLYRLLKFSNSLLAAYFYRMLGTVFFIMNAKLKAKELVEKMMLYSFERNKLDDKTIHYNVKNKIEKESAIKCAKILVDEILESQPTYKYWDTYDDETPSAIIFWNEVKTELDVLSSYCA